MKKDIQPKYEQASITCTTCGTVWPVRSTKPVMRLDICSNCHPFYTGEQRIVDTAGQVDRFMRRLAATQQKQANNQARQQQKEQPKKKSLLQEIYGDEEE